MKIIFFDGQSYRDIAHNQIKDCLAQPGGTVWIDVCGLTDDDAEFLCETFGFHPLAIEDTRNKKQRPKAEEYSDHLFIILNSVNGGLHDDDLVRELDVFVGSNYIVTVHVDDEPLLKRVRTRLEPNRVSFTISSTYLLYALFDEVVDGYRPLLESLEDELDQLANQVFTHPDPSVLTRLFQLQQMLSSIGRVLFPQQDVVNVLMNHQLLFIDQNSQYYLRDISDHQLRSADMVRILRDTVNSLLNLYISTVSYRLNHHVNRLTLLAVIIGVMTVISGFYGMNFETNWPPFSSEWSVPLVMLMMVVAVGAILFSIKRNN